MVFDSTMLKKMRLLKNTYYSLTSVTVSKKPNRVIVHASEKFLEINSQSIFGRVGAGMDC